MKRLESSLLSIAKHGNVILHFSVFAKSPLVDLARKGYPSPFLKTVFIDKKGGYALLRTNRKYKNLSFTFDEWAEIECRAKEVNMKTATYIKAMALQGQIVNIDLSAAYDVVVAINKVGNNVNQIAKLANQTGLITESEYHQLMEWRNELSRILKAYLSTIQSGIV